MEARYDIRIQKAFINAHNDLEWFASDIQHIEDIIQATPGSYKESPTLGIAAKNYINSSGAEKEVARKVMIQLQSDLYPCNNPIVKYSSPGVLTIDPNIQS
jgi:hypothetical protein